MSSSSMSICSEALIFFLAARKAVC